MLLHVSYSYASRRRMCARKVPFKKVWSSFVHQDGIILMHDTNSHHPGPKKLFGEIDMPKTNFRHSSGLGVLTHNMDLLNKIRKEKWNG